MEAFYAYVAHEERAFRLVFESDVTNEPAVRERVDRVTAECSRLIAGVIHEDTGLPDEASDCWRSPSWEWPRSALGSGCTRTADSPRSRPPHWCPDSPGVASAVIPAPTETDPTDENWSPLMEVKIGVQNAARELTLDIKESADDVAAEVAAAIKDDGVLPSPTPAAARCWCPPRSWRTSRSAAASPAPSASAPDTPA